MDSWLGPSPLWQSYPAIFQVASNTELLVGEALRTSPPLVSFLRALLPAEEAEWNAVKALIGQRRTSPGADEVSWTLTASGVFSVKSLYSKLTEGAVLDIARGLWKAGLPLKIKIFLWQMFQNRLPTADNVAKRNGPSDGSCVVCGTLEDANHALFRCHLARFAWSAVRASFQQNWNPSSGADLLQIIRTQKGASARIVWRCVGALLWSLWTA